MPSKSDPARAWLHAHLKPDMEKLRAALGNAQADAYVAGSLAMAQTELNPLQVAVVGSAHNQTLKQYWNKWTPGNVQAGDLLDAGGFQQLLSSQGVTIKGITDTVIDQLGTALAQGAARGDSVDTIAQVLQDILDNPDRAYRIADTELNRAVTQSALDTFTANGIEQWDWLVSDGACPECEAMADSNPHSMGDDQPPLHPMCRCAASPVGPATAPDEENSSEDGA